MKAQIIQQTCYEGFLAYTHGMGQEVQRILVSRANNLVITPYNESLYVWDGFQMEESDCQVISEIEVSDDLVKEAIKFMNAKKKLCPVFQELIAPGSSDPDSEEIDSLEG